MKLDALHYSLAALSMFLLLLFFFSPYRYESTPTGLMIRIHRITGATEYFTWEGWGKLP